MAMEPHPPCHSQMLRAEHGWQHLTTLLLGPGPSTATASVGFIDERKARSESQATARARDRRDPVPTPKPTWATATAARCQGLKGQHVAQALRRSQGILACSIMVMVSTS